MGQTSPVPHISPRARALTAGFGLLDVVLSVALVATAGVVALALFGNNAEQRRAQAMVDEIAAIRASVEKAYGDAILSGNVVVNVATIAQLGLVGETYLRGKPPSSINNPWGDAIKLTSTAGTPGYQIDLGYMPSASCIAVLSNLATADELTGLAYDNTAAASSAATLVTNQAVYTSNPLTLTESQISSACTNMEGAGMGNGITLTMRNINAVTSANAFVVGPLAPVSQPNGPPTTPTVATTAQMLGNAQYSAGVPSFSIAQTGQKQITVTASNISAAVDTPAGGSANGTTANGNNAVGSANVNSSLTVDLPAGQQFSSLVVNPSTSFSGQTSGNAANSPVAVVEGWVTDAEGQSFFFQTYEYPEGTSPVQEQLNTTASCPSGQTCTGPLTISILAASYGPSVTSASGNSVTLSGVSFNVISK